MSTARRLPLALMYVGLALTVVVAVVPLLGQQVLEDHVRHGYPDYSADELDSAVNGWLTVLAVLGGLGVIGWAASIWATHRQVRPRLVSSAMLGLGLALSLTAALTKDTSGEVGLAPAYGALLLLPCLVGVGAVALLWREAMQRSPNARLG